MKRLLTFIIAIIYFCISSGFIMNVHYCMGKLSNVNIEIIPSTLCGCGKKETKGCCKTESKFYKITDNYEATYANFNITIPTHTLPTFYSHTHTVVTSTIATNIYNTHAPPIFRPQLIYILNCVFRI